MEDAIDYALRYGGRCRDCADTKIDGVCDINGTPCNPRVFRAAIEHALRAWRYGIEHGFIVSPFAHAKDGCAAKDARIAELEAENTDLKDQLGDPEGVVAHSDAIIAMSEKVELENEALKAALLNARDALEVFSLANQAIKTFDPGFPAEGAALRASFDVYTRFLGRDNSEEVSRMAVTRSDIQNAAEAFELARAALQGGQGNG